MLLFFVVTDKAHPLGKRSLTMENFVFTNQKIFDTAQEFLTIKVDVNKIGKDILKKYRIKTAPTVLFVTSTGKVLTRVVGKSKPDRMLKLMKAVLAKNKAVLKKAGLS